MSSFQTMPGSGLCSRFPAGQSSASSPPLTMQYAHSRDDASGVIYRHFKQNYRLRGGRSPELDPVWEDSVEEALDASGDLISQTATLGVQHSGVGFYDEEGPGIVPISLSKRPLPLKVQAALAFCADMENLFEDVPQSELNSKLVCRSKLEPVTTAGHEASSNTSC
mmetsp:Transcript_95488/g.270043  ORF Transcript_95488/g.270043 Transcript_95488/m.270043 type:complete len:166 (+) Transcript_95488:36-533(+)